MNVLGQNWMKSSKSSLVAPVGAGELFIALPIFFLIQQPRRGPFTAFMAIEVAALCALAGVFWGLFMWFVFIEQKRKRMMR